MDKLVSGSGLCLRCTRPLDDHCWKCEVVVLCPYTDKEGHFHSPCARVGPAHRETK